MYAIIQTGGKQYQVSPGSYINVEKLEAEVGQEVTIDQVLLFNDGDNVKVGTPIVANTAVKAQVIDHCKARKVIIFKFKRRKNYRKKTGHRQPFTRLHITDIVTA